MLERLNRRQLMHSAIAAMSLPATTSIAAACGPSPTLPLTQGLANLSRVYASKIASVDPSRIVLASGEIFPVSLFSPSRPHWKKIEEPDLAAQLTQNYPRSNCAMPRTVDHDPGRIRFTPFFQSLYGRTQIEVERNLVSVRWPGRNPNTMLRVTKILEVAAQVAKIADELAALPRAFHKFFDRPGGSYYWRPIAGTNRLSAHAFGIAIDITVSESLYWRDQANPGDTEETWKSSGTKINKIPFEIINIFERHGFIWGGKWYHYDTMHFEYRPELLLA